MTIDIKNLPWPEKPGMENKKEYVLEDNLFLEQWTIPKGVQVRLITSEDFGTLTLPENCKDTSGFVIPRRIFQF